MRVINIDTKCEIIIITVTITTPHSTSIKVHKTECRYNVTLRHFHVTIVAAEKQ